MPLVVVPIHSLGKIRRLEVLAERALKDATGISKDFSVSPS